MLDYNVILHFIGMNECFIIQIVTIEDLSHNLNWKNNRFVLKFH